MKRKTTQDSFHTVLKIVFGFVFGIILLAILYKAVTGSIDIRSNAASNCTALCKVLISHPETYQVCMTRCQEHNSGTTRRPDCYYKQVQCVKVPCPPVLVCPTVTPTPVDGCNSNGSKCTIYCPPIPFCPNGKTCPPVDIPYPCSAQNLSPTGTCVNHRCVSPITPTPTAMPAPKPTILTPNGGEVWVRGNSYLISWNENVTTKWNNLSLYMRSGTTDTYIGKIADSVSNTVGSNSYSWTVPMQAVVDLPYFPDGVQLILSIRQYDTDSNLIAEAKSNPFTVMTQPTIITPAGGEVWVRGNSYLISWNESVPTASTALFLYTRSGTTDSYIGGIASYVSNQVGANSYSWTIPAWGTDKASPPDGGQAIISVGQYDTSGNRIVEAKSAPFTVVTP